MPGIGREKFLYTAVRRMGLRHNYNLMLLILKRFYPDVYSCVERNMCPFCGSMFASRQQLITHLKRKNICRRAFLIIAKEITEIHGRIRYCIKSRSGGKYIAMVSGRCRTFTSLDDALDYVLQHDPQLWLRAKNFYTRGYTQ